MFDSFNTAFFAYNFDLIFWIKFFIGRSVFGVTGNGMNPSFSGFAVYESNDELFNRLPVNVRKGMKAFFEIHAESLG